MSCCKNDHARVLLLLLLPSPMQNARQQKSCWWWPSTWWRCEQWWQRGAPTTQARLKFLTLLALAFAGASLSFSSVCSVRSNKNNVRNPNNNDNNSIESDEAFRISSRRRSTTATTTTTTTTTVTVPDLSIQHTPSGCVYTPADTPVCVAENVCLVSESVVAYHIAPFAADKWPWSPKESIEVNSQESLVEAWRIFKARCCSRRFMSAHECVLAERLGFTCCGQQYHSANEPRLLNASTTSFLQSSALFLDTAVDFFQYGHTISKLIQLASFARWGETYAPRTGPCARPVVTWAIFSRVKGRSLPAALRDWMEVVVFLLKGTTPDPVSIATLEQSIYLAALGTLNSSANLSPQTPPTPPPRCLRHAFFIHDYEQFYFRPSDAEELNRAAETHLGIPSCPDRASPPRSGMFLVREEGSGGRKFVNHVDVENVVGRVFGLQTANVTISSSMTASQQAGVFRDHGLIVGPHSSQLKNLAVACPCTIAIEINAMDGAREPFSVGLHHRGIVYVQSAGHIPVTYGKPVPADVLARRFFDVSVNVTKLEEDLLRGLDAHRKHGCKTF